MYYVLEFIVILLFIYYVGKKTNINFYKDLKNINIKEILVYSLSFVCIIMALYLLFNYFGLVTINKIDKNNINILRCLITVTLTPLLEEFVFRYLPLKLFRNKYLIIIVGSLLFTLAHNVTVYESVIVFIASIMLYFMYIKTGRISNSVISHALWNLCVLLISLV